MIGFTRTTHSKIEYLISFIDDLEKFVMSECHEDEKNQLGDNLTINSRLLPYMLDVIGI